MQNSLFNLVVCQFDKSVFFNCKYVFVYFLVGKRFILPEQL
jgi:hypothetical protein